MTRILGISICAFFCLLAFSESSSAAVAPSRFRVETKRDKNMLRVKRLLERKDVRERLAKLGMDSKEIEARLGSIEDPELELLADRLDSVAVGRGAVGLIIVVLVIAALVLLIIWLAQRV